MADNQPTKQGKEAKDGTSRDSSTCGAHGVMEYKNNLAMALLGANLFGVVIIAIGVAWALFSSIPGIETRIGERLDKLNARIEAISDQANLLEYRITEAEKLLARRKK